MIRTFLWVKKNITVTTKTNEFVTNRMDCRDSGALLVFEVSVSVSVSVKRLVFVALPTIVD